MAGVTWRLSRSRDVQILGRMVRRVDTSDRVVALTFDDGPTPGYSEEILHILQVDGVRATFFVTGADLGAHPELGQRIVADGHELGNHSHSHRAMVGRSFAFIRDEIERTDRLIRAAGHEGEIYFRPPYSKRFLALPAYLSATGRTTIMFDVEPESYPEIAADHDRVVDHVVEEVRPGSIILLHVMHEGCRETMEAVPAIIRELRELGYRFVTVSELLACGK
jgi:peptidoglycan/xylan/chitin deacetylase (PgdA/CDA1 family)